MKQSDVVESDVLIIGAGPSGAIAGAILKQRGFRVAIVEKSHFPRFSIGESLLPHCMEFIESAGLLDDVMSSGFQHKDGAAFSLGDAYTDFDFNEKFSAGWGSTFQVERAQFDKVLADGAEQKGVDIYYGWEVTDVCLHEMGVTLEVCSGTVHKRFEGQFVLDASGFGRVLPRLLELEKPSEFPVRQSLFTHIEDNIQCPQYDRNKILIGIHPNYHDVWYWLIPFGNGRSSLGVVAEQSFFDSLTGDAESLLRELVAQAPRFESLLKDAKFDTKVSMITGYAADVQQLYGERYALLGNAGEFLDPVFSSGVTIAMKSAALAVDVLSRQLQGEAVDWAAEYSVPLRSGIDTFRACVELWYEGKLQDIFFYPHADPQVRSQICAILAGYAWDENNPFVREPRRRLEALAHICQEPA